MAGTKKAGTKESGAKSQQSETSHSRPSVSPYPTHIHGSSFTTDSFPKADLPESIPGIWPCQQSAKRSCLTTHAGRHKKWTTRHKLERCERTQIQRLEPSWRERLYNAD